MAGATAAALLISALTASTPATAATPAAESIRLAAGAIFSIVTRADGVPYGAGSNLEGALTGTGDRSTLTPLSGLPRGVRAIEVAASAGHVLVLGSDGAVYGAGRNGDGHLTGSGNKSVLTRLVGLPAGVRATAIAAPVNNSLVVGSNGVAYGTGRNVNSQLTGLNPADKTVLTPLTGLPAGVTATAVAGGQAHSVVLGSNGIPYGAGANNEGQLTGSLNRTTLTPFAMPAGATAVAIAAGERHTLVLSSTGIVYGTGRNAEGQITGAGTAARTSLSAMTGLPSGVRATSISGGAYFSVVLAATGTAYGTGRNSDGQLTGTGPQTTLTAMTGIGTTGATTAVAAGSDTTLVRTRDGRVFGTGWNAYSQLTGPASPSKTTLTPLTGQVVAPSIRPIVTRSPKVGATSRVSVGSWSPTPTAYTYQWRRSGVAIWRANRSTYRAVKADTRRTLSVTVSGSRAGMVTGSATISLGRVLGAPLRYTARKKPAIRGTAKVGKTLRVKNLKKRGWSPDASRHAYRWYHGSTRIKGADHSKYRLRKSDRGKKIRVRIYATRSGYATGHYTTRATAKVRK